MRKRDAIIALVKNHSTKYLKHKHKFGIECPKTVEDALELDKQNGNTTLADAFAKEMKNVQVATMVHNHLLDTSSIDAI